MDRDPGLQAMQDIVDRMTREGASQEDIDAALMEFAYRHGHAQESSGGVPLPDDASAEACYLRACGLFEAFRDDEAEACLKRALELDPDYFDAKRLLLQLEEDDEVLSKKLADLEREVEARWNETGRAGAGSAWENALGRTLLQVKADRAFLCYDLGRYRPALAACEQALALDGDDRQNLRGLLVMLYAYFEDGDAARALWERYGNEESSWFLLGMALVAYKEGDLARTRERFARFLALYPDLLVEFSLFMAGSAQPPSRQSSKREQQRDDVYGALEDAAAVVDSTPGFVNWLSLAYADQLFGD